tara:strand:- start:31170 stop:31529 length:360 start_codon:yes stop_codon:yes gene_type:complete
MLKTNTPRGQRNSAHLMHSNITYVCETFKKIKKPIAFGPVHPYSLGFHVCTKALSWQPIRRGVAQPGSASGLGPEGRRFESCLPDHLKKASTVGAGFFYLLMRLEWNRAGSTKIAGGYF